VPHGAERTPNSSPHRRLQWVCMHTTSTQRATFGAWCLQKTNSCQGDPHWLRRMGLFQMAYLYNSPWTERMGLDQVLPRVASRRHASMGLVSFVNDETEVSSMTRLGLAAALYRR